MRRLVRSRGRHRHRVSGVRRATGALAILAMASVLAIAFAVAFDRNPRDDADDGSARGTVPSKSALAGEPPRPEGSPADEEDPHLSLVAEAIVREIGIYEEPGAAEPTRTLDHPTDVGAPLVFLVRKRQGDWLKVQLPVRPNGSTGWIHADQVSLFGHRYRVIVELGKHRIQVVNGEEPVLDASVAIGKQDTPTPGGSYYIKELLKPPNPNSVYGTYAYGLSGFSNVLEKFNGGEGVIGIHGTNDPSVIGRDVSSGCIRMRNKDIEKLVPILPLGTPVRII